MGPYYEIQNLKFHGRDIERDFLPLVPKPVRTTRKPKRLVRGGFDMWVATFFAKFLKAHG